MHTIEDQPAVGLCGSGLVDAVAAFLDGKIGFTDIPKILEKTVLKEFSSGDSFEEVFETDKEARKFASSLI